MGKKKSVVLMVLITIVMVALCVLTAFPSFTVPGTEGIKIWNPAIMQFDLGIDLGADYAANTNVGGGYYAYYYPEGVIPEADYQTNVRLLEGEDLTDYQEKYFRHGGLYLSTDPEDGILDSENNEYFVTDEFKAAFDAATKEIGARFAKKGYEDFLVTRVDDYALRIELPASQNSKNVTAATAAQQALRVFGMTGEMTFQQGGSVVDAMKDEEVTIQDIVKSIKVKTQYDYAYLEIKFTKAGISMLNAYKTAAASDTSATLDIAIGDEVLLNLSTSHIDGNVIKYTMAENVDKHYVETIAILFNSVYDNGGFDISFNCGDISSFSPVYNGNSLYFVFGAVLLILVAFIVFAIVKYGRFGVVTAYANVTYLLIAALCFAFVSQGVFVVTLGSLLTFLVGLALMNMLQYHIYNAIKAEFVLGKTIASSVKGGYKKTIWNVVDVYAVLTLAALALLIGCAGLQTFALQTLICVLGGAFCNLAWARFLNFTLLSASKNKFKYFRFVREDDDDE